MRVLLLTPFPPSFDATHGGARVIGQVVHNLADRHCVAVMYLRGNSEPGMDPTVKARCDHVWEIARPSHNTGGPRHWTHRLWTLYRLLRGRPEWVTNWHVPTLHDQLKLAIQTWNPDVIQVEYSVMGQYLQGLRAYRIPSILTIYEPTAHATAERDLRPRRRAVQLWLDRRAWKRYERNAIATASAVVVFTHRDRDIINKLSPKTRIVCIPLGSELTGRPLDPLGSTPASTIFIGNFSHPPNLDAAERLIHSIFPKVQEQVPDVTLLIVGDGAPDGLRQMATESIVVTGWVSSVIPYLDRAAVVVAPIRSGGGTRVKILEALVAGKAIVASPRAVEGLDIQAGVHVVIAEDDQEFADAVTSLLRNDNLRMELAGNARSWAMTNLGWSDSMTLYEGLYSSLIQNSPADDAGTIDHSSNELEARNRGA